jgi:hypothetical protein
MTREYMTGTEPGEQLLVSIRQMKAGKIGRVDGTPYSGTHPAVTQAVRAEAPRLAGKISVWLWGRAGTYDGVRGARVILGNLLLPPRRGT